MKFETKFLLQSFLNHFQQKIISPNGYIFSKPNHFHIAPTARCNCTCQMCDIHKLNIEDLKFDLIVDMLIKIKKWLNGGFFLNIAGGEVLLYKDIYKLVEFCSKNKIILRMTTNGSLLNRAACDKLLASGLSCLSVSIDSLNPAIHDSLRGFPGILEKALAGIDYLVEHKVKVGVQTVISNKNRNELCSLSKTLFEKYNISNILFQPVETIVCGDVAIEDFVKHELWIKDLDELKHSIESLVDLKKKNYNILNTIKELYGFCDFFKNSFEKKFTKRNKCSVGKSNFFIGPRGDVRFCWPLEPFGNIISDGLSPSELWNAKQTRELRLKTLHCQRACPSACHRSFSLWYKIKYYLMLAKD